MSCKGGCGFHGSDAREGYCSVCYTKHGQSTAAATPPTASATSGPPPTTLPSTNAPAVPAAVNGAPAKPSSALPKPKEPSESRFAYLRGLPEAQISKDNLQKTVSLAQQHLQSCKVCDVVWMEPIKALRLRFAEPVNKAALDAPVAMLAAAVGADSLTTQLLTDSWVFSTAEEVRTVALEELKKLIQSGDVKPDTEVKHAALYPDWTAVKDVKELQEPEDAVMTDEQVDDLQACKGMEFNSWAAKQFPALTPILKIGGIQWALDGRTKWKQVVELLAPLNQSIDERKSFHDKIEFLKKHDAMHPDCVKNWKLGANVQVYNKKKEEWFLDGRIIQIGEGPKAGKYQIEYDLAKKKKWAAWGSMRPPLVNVVSSKKRKQAEEGKRCWQCNKRLKMINSWECKCLAAWPTSRFCTGCRNPTSHNCTYDHAAEQRVNLLKKNPLIAPAKLQRRISDGK